MYTSLIHRIVIFCGFSVALICFSWNLFVRGNELLMSAFVSLCVMLGVSTVLLLAMQSVAQVLVKHLTEQRRLHSLALAEQERKKKKDKKG
jgi:hypothetical protein